MKRKVEGLESNRSRNRGRRRRRKDRGPQEPRTDQMSSTGLMGLHTVCVCVCTCGVPEHSLGISVCVDDALQYYSHVGDLVLGQLFQCGLNTKGGER